MNLLTTPILYGLGAATLAAALFAGVQTVRLSHERNKVLACQADLTTKTAALAITAATLKDIDADTIAAKKRADDAAAYAAEMAKQAIADEKVYRASLAAVERELAEAGRDPGCRAQLDMQSCAALH